MTELAVPEAAPVAAQNGNATAPQQQMSAGAGALVEWAQQADIAYQMAHKLAATSFVPQSLRGKPGDVAAAILAGQELGLKPMATLKSIDVIQGTPALRAHAMRGILQNKGHEIELVETDEQHCVMRGRRAGSENWQTVVWTIQRAAKLGLTGKGEWKKQPQTMLVARATGEICRLIASDALHGMPYAAEELSGTTELTVEQVRAPLSVSAITAAPTPAAQPEPPVEEFVDPEADDAEHAAAVAELDAFGAEYEAPDIRGDAFRELGLPVEDAPAQAIRDLVTKWRTAAA
ncbi:hypothetical protein RVR_8254 [Actinacidiphila reveromycinica]|uniref:Uncharacterized protein n=1 Tax=Actinacidiphila reveromycinica TaxID=659352 RepID=A0A7U3UY95_9ACTN|nr:hypothetical protein [Streptomyces sp. SN-593]BBB01022.1 hypothetical protein RVR_8254 [Streptomyces sp. SN-593]